MLFPSSTEVVVVAWPPLKKKTVEVVVVVEVWGGVRLWPVVCRPSIPIGRYCYCHRGGFKKKVSYTLDE